jgi:hypothetical protein
VLQDVVYLIFTAIPEYKGLKDFTSRFLETGTKMG